MIIYVVDGPNGLQLREKPNKLNYDFDIDLGRELGYKPVVAFEVEEGALGPTYDVCTRFADGKMSLKDLLIRMEPFGRRI